MRLKVETPKLTLRSLEIVAIRVEDSLWWIVYKVKGQISGGLNEIGVHPEGWLWSLIAVAEEEVRERDVRIKGLIAARGEWTKPAREVNKSGSQ